MLLAVIIPIGVVIGAIAHQLLPKAELRGSLLLPAIGVGAASVVWTLFSWIGLEDSGWIWLASLGTSVVATVLTGLFVSNARDNKNKAMLSAV